MRAIPLVISLWLCPFVVMAGERLDKEAVMDMLHDLSRYDRSAEDRLDALVANESVSTEILSDLKSEAPTWTERLLAQVAVHLRGNPASFRDLDTRLEENHAFLKRLDWGGERVSIFEHLDKIDPPSEPERALLSFRLFSLGICEDALCRDENRAERQFLMLALVLRVDNHPVCYTGPPTNFLAEGNEVVDGLAIGLLRKGMPNPAVLDACLGYIARRRLKRATPVILRYADGWMESRLCSMGGLAQYLAYIGDERSVPVIIAWSRNEEPLNRGMCAPALYYFNQPDCLERLEEMAKSDPTDNVRDHARYWLNKAKPPINPPD